ncbi:MAG: carboxypeptidase-like regulatory domain-containing protein [Planctomycetota bacterium]|jgi:hypothetical protein
MKPTDIDRLIKCLGAQPSRHLDERIDALLGALPETVLPSTRRTILRNRTTQLALAASVFLAFIVGIPLLNSNNNRLWARVLENTRNIGNYSFRLTKIVKDLGTQESRGDIQETSVRYVWKDHGTYYETYAHGELDHKTYVIYDSNQLILVYPTTKEYERRPYVSLLRYETPKKMTLWLLDKNYTELGEKTINGRVCVGIENRRDPDTLPEGVDKWHSEIWFDMETLLPAYTETSFVIMDSNSFLVIQQDQFKYGLEFPSDFLDPYIPDDYTPTVVGGLRLFSELKGGRYPRNLRYFVEQELGDQAEVERAIEAMSPPSGNYGYDALRRTMGFYHRIISESRDSGYYGDRVTAEDSSRILLYWWDYFGQNYQVIWGDLRVEALSRDQLIESCYVAGDCAVLLALLERDDVKSVQAIAECLEQIGEASIIPTLLKHADRWYDGVTDNPLMKTIEAIRRRYERQNPFVILMVGRLYYPNGKGSTHGLIRIGTKLHPADRNGCFIIELPSDDAPLEHLGYAYKWNGTCARLFSWRKADQPSSLRIVLGWISTIRGRVVNQEGAPQSNVEVGLSARLGGDAGRYWPDGNRTRTDAGGHFIFEKVPPGAPLELIIENYNDSQKPLRVPIDEIESDHKYDMGDIVLNR